MIDYTLFVKIIYFPR